MDLRCLLVPYWILHPRPRSFRNVWLHPSLSLSRSSRSVRICGVAGLTHKSPTQSVAEFSVSPIQPSGKKFDVTAIVVPRVTCNLPTCSVEFNPSWEHLRDLTLADPSFGRPSKIDLLLGVEVFTQTLLSGRRVGPSIAPIAIETEFGWVLAGRAEQLTSGLPIASHHASFLSSDDVLRKFWEVEENLDPGVSYTQEEQLVVKHFRERHVRTTAGRFAVSLPRKPDSNALGESRSQAVRRFLSLERSLISKNQFDDFHKVMQEYFDMGHAELVPVADLEKSPQQVFYLPMHAVRKDSSTTTKIRAVFDASVKSSSGVSLNDTLMVGPTVHPSLTDVLIRFRMHRIALVADVSRMYRAIELVDHDRDFHRFVWRNNPSAPLMDYRMTRTLDIWSSGLVICS